MTEAPADFLDMESSLIVSLHIQSVDQIKAIKTVSARSPTWTAARLRNRKRLSVPGYDMDIIPSATSPGRAEAEEALEDLQSRERANVPSPSWC